MTTYISQGSAATDLRGDESFNSNFLRRSLMNLTVKKLWKLDYFWWNYSASKLAGNYWHTLYTYYLLKLSESKLWQKSCNFTLLLTKTRGLRLKLFSVCSKHIICLHCYYEHSKCSPLALTHAVRWWRHCCAAHAWWYDLESLHR